MRFPQHDILMVRGKSFQVFHDSHTFIWSHEPDNTHQPRIWQALSGSLRIPLFRSGPHAF
jgi:hypothetical protein